MDPSGNINGRDQCSISICSAALSRSSIWGGFTRAGERLHRTQSTVSQQIRRLEETFGRPLLHRDGKHVRPTEEGERLLSYARRLLALAEEAREVVSRPTGDGLVRLGL